MMSTLFRWWQRLVFVIGLFAISLVAGNPLQKLLPHETDTVLAKVPSPDQTQMAIALRSSSWGFRGRNCEVEIRVVSAKEKLDHPGDVGHRFVAGGCHTFEQSGPNAAKIQWTKPNRLRVTVPTA